MAASLLADIDWTNLDSAEMTTAVKVLCIAMQERFNIGAMNMDGTYSTSGTPANPSDDTLKDMFPYKTNTPRWPLNDGDPLIDYTNNQAAQDDLVHLIQNAAQHYADIEKWNDAATNKDSGDTRFVLSGAADAPGTYDNRLLEVTGYTTYPDLTVMAPEEVKKLYDMVVIMRYVVRNTQATLRSNVHRVFGGEFDVSQAGNFSEGDDGDGANYYNSGSSSDVTPITNTTPYSAFETGNSNLFGSSAASFDESTDSGTYEPPFFGGVDQPYYIKLVVTSGKAGYRNLIRAFQTHFVIDWATPKTAVGFIGKPLEYKTQNNMTSLTNTFPTGFDTNFNYPATTTAVDERYWETVTISTTLEVVTVKRDNLLVGVTLPAAPNSLAASDVIEVDPRMGGNLIVFQLEDWDGDGGFEYYTPAP